MTGCADRSGKRFVSKVKFVVRCWNHGLASIGQFHCTKRRVVYQGGVVELKEARKKEKKKGVEVPVSSCHCMCNPNPRNGPRNRTMAPVTIGLPTTVFLIESKRPGKQYPPVFFPFLFFSLSFGRIS